MRPALVLELEPRSERLARWLVVNVLAPLLLGLGLGAATLAPPCDPPAPTVQASRP